MGRLLDRIITASIEHRWMVLFVAAVLVVVGSVVTSRASLDALPNFTPPQVVVQTEAPGMSATDVEQLVTDPIERVLLGTPQTSSVRSISAPGLSVVTIVFAEGLDIYRVRQLVTERLQLVQPHLPATVQAPRLAPIAAPVGALFKLCLTSDAKDQAKAMQQLRTFADWTLRPRLLAIPGVSQVVTHGGDVEQIEVQPDPARMQQHNVSLAQIRAAVRGSQAVSAAGFVETPSARTQVRTDSRLPLVGAADDLAEVPVVVRGGIPVRLGDVARVVHGHAPRIGAALYDGRPAVFIQIMKLPGADTLRLSERVEQALRQVRGSLPEGAHIAPPVFRQASFITTSISSVGRAMGLGALLVIVVLFAFLRSGRLAAVSLTAIPLSVLAAAAVLVGSGASLNGMTLGGLAIAVGEVVDDAIVDVENIWRRLRLNAVSTEPRPVLRVIHDASREVRGSVVYATLIVVVVLVPVLLLGGIAGRIFAPLAEAYILAITASLLVALTVTPAMCAWLLPKLAQREQRLPRLSTWLLERYRRVLRRTVEHPRWVLGSAGVLAAAAMVAIPFLGGRFLPEMHEASVIAHLDAVPGTSLPDAVRLSRRVDHQLRPAVASHVAAHIGRAELGEDPFPVNRVEMDVVLRPRDNRDWETIVRDIEGRIAHVPGLTFSVEGFLGERIHEILAGETAPLVVKVLGPDLAVLRSAARRVMGAMRRAGLGAIRMEPQIDIPQLRIQPRRAALARWGVRPRQLAIDVADWRQGQPVSQIAATAGRLVNIVVAGPPALRSQAALADLPIDAAGGAVPLGELARIRSVAAPAVVHHEGGERRISIGADAAGGGLSGAAARLEHLLARMHLPAGYRYEVAGEAVARRAAGLRLLGLGAVVLVVIFMLLGTAFHSSRDAGIALLNFPLGLIGGVLGAMINPEGLSVAGLVGFITLFGIITRNGIMLVTHKQHLDATEPERDATARVAQAAEERLLPILMTAATAGLGLLPLALSLGGRGSEIETPMAVIVCGGLVTATALNMLVLPTLYVWLERRRARRSR